MTLLFDKAGPIDSPTLAPGGASDDRDTRSGSDRRKVLEIGLVNNMGDAALRATERQFARLLKAGAGEHAVRLHYFALPSVPRAAAARHRIDSLYSGFADLGRIVLDGLIVTGAEPRAPKLCDELYWDDFRRLVDWAEANTRSTIWSCLAAHGAVLHLDGIERRRLPRKCSGVFSGERLRDDALLADLPSPMQVPHSRLNDLDADDLGNSAYDILTQAVGAGVDIFAREARSRFVFFQGHPEYEPASLQREYLRDVGRYLAGERDDYPDVPQDYFCAATEAALATFRKRASTERRPDMISALPQLSLRPGLAGAIEASATTLFRNWLVDLAGRA
jgi:homoserine O-succinyltransferase